jgi:hypothetical protein
MNLRVIAKPRNYDVIMRFRNYVTTLAATLEKSYSNNIKLLFKLLIKSALF